LDTVPLVNELLALPGQFFRFLRGVSPDKCGDLKKCLGEVEMKRKRGDSPIVVTSSK